MQLSWGTKIMVLYVGFVMLIITMVSLTMREKVDLVTKDYYAQELNYQEKINTVNRTKALGESLTWEMQSDALVLKFPKQLSGQGVEGSIYFFRPSDSSLDVTVPLPAIKDSTCTVATNLLKKGVYKMQVNWEVNKQSYYNEGIIRIN